MTVLEDIDYNKQIAATMIIRFLAHAKLGEDFESLTKISERVLKYDEPKHLVNFLEGRSSGVRGEARARAHEIVATAKTLFSDLRNNEGRFADDVFDHIEIPSCIEAMYESAFGEDRQQEATAPQELPHRRALDEVADYLAHAKINDYKTTSKLRTALADRIYDVYRWASPSRSNENPRAIRAGLRFSHPTKLENFLQFTIHYKPHELDEEGKEKNHSTTRGVMIPIGDHVLMIGAESNTDYPLVIWATIDTDNPQEFRGLVLRRADSKNDLFAARVVFRQNTDASELKDIDDKIGIIPEEILTEAETALLKKVLNNVENGGKQALSYIPLVRPKEPNQGDSASD